MPTKKPRWLIPPLGSIIDRYFIKEVFQVFFGAVWLILFILMMFQTMRLAEYFIVHAAPVTVLLKIACSMSVTFLPLTLPIAFLLSILVSMGRLSADHEWVALQASGVSLTRLCIPLLFCAGILSVLSLALTMEWVPESEATTKKLIVKLGNTKMTSQLKAGAFTNGFFDLLIFAGKVDPNSNHLEQIFIYDEREPKSPLTYIAREAELIALPTEKDLETAVLLKLKGGSIHQTTLENESYQKTDFETYSLYLKIEEGHEEHTRRPQMIPYKELMGLYKQSDSSQIQGREVQAEFWRRIQNAITPFIFAPLGLSFARRQVRSGRSTAIVTGFLIILAYWSLQVLALSFSQQGKLPPVLALAIPNLTLLLLTLYQIRPGLSK